MIGADGAAPRSAAQCVHGRRHGCRYVFAYHEIVRAPAPAPAGFDRRALRRLSIAAGCRPTSTAGSFRTATRRASAPAARDKGFSLRGAVAALRAAPGLADAETLRREGAPIPMKPLRRWDNGRDVVLAGDAAGVVAPASGEGIYYAMVGGRLAAEAVDAFLQHRRCARAARRPQALHAGARPGVLDPAA